MATTRKKLVIDRRQIAGVLREFPVLVHVTDPALMTQNQPIGFTDDHGQALAHEIRRHDRTAGELQAFVRVPLLLPDADTVLYLTVGDATPRLSSDVWDEHHRLVLHAPAKGRVAADERLDIADAITVEAWVDCRHPRAEAMQALVSRWPLRKDWGEFAAYDAGTTDGMDTTGFFGAVFDGRYIYFSPQYDRENRHGKALRYDTHGPFKYPHSWEAYDAGVTDGMVTKGYYGAVFDGRYVIYPPRREPNGFHSRALRYDTHGAFTDPSSWRAFDVGASHSSQSGAFDGRYIYFCPGQLAMPRKDADQKTRDTSPKVTGMGDDMLLASSGTIIRYNTHGEFDDPASWTMFDASNTDGLDTRDFDGAIFDGRYIHFAPLSYGMVLRYDTHGEFHDRASWAAYDAAKHGVKRCVGAIFDGRYVYHVPYGNTQVAVRYDTRGDFRDDDAWQVYRITDTRGLKVTGYDGAFFDGRYVYYIPYWDEGKVLHGVLLRYDTTSPFDRAESWSCIDAGLTDGLMTTGFNGGATDGRYLYFAAWMNDKKFEGRIGGGGRMLRYDTTGAEASFSLRFCDVGHNGGLCAALPGPRFLVNTEHGPISIAANQAPPPEAGRHHLAGVYDGRSIRLYIDGQLVNEQSASGNILPGAGDLALGGILDGRGEFDGSIEEVRISDTPRSRDWIQTQYNNLINPSAFCRLTD